MKIIELLQVTKSFGKQIVLDKVSYVFESAKCYLLIGENGSGKSTLLKGMLGLINFDSGTVQIPKTAIGYVPERMVFPEFLSIDQCLSELARIRGLKEIKASENIAALLKAWDLSDSRDRKMGELSKGMHQKVLIIQALLTSSELYFFDEPMSGLDEKSQRALIGQMEILKQHKKTLIVTTHYPKQYEPVADVALKMEDGRLNEKSDILPF
jgi:ABC-type multidrug transport system ATPase subunit